MSTNSPVRPYSLSILYKMGDVPRDQSQSVKLCNWNDLKWEYGKVASTLLIIHVIRHVSGSP